MVLMTHIPCIAYLYAVSLVMEFTQKSRTIVSNSSATLMVCIAEDIVARQVRSVLKDHNIVIANSNVKEEDDDDEAAEAANP